MMFNQLLLLVAAVFTTSSWAWAEKVTIFGTEDGTKWPRRELGANNIRYTAIRYCFARPKERFLFEDLLIKSWQLWADKLGPPGPQTTEPGGRPTSGHSLVFGEVRWPRQNGVEYPEGTRYCWNWVAGQLSWNNVLPIDVLIIRAGDAAFFPIATASVGYSDPQRMQAVGQNEVTIQEAIRTRYPDESIRVAYVAHELGHTLGLTHEHQRPDRNRYVKFQCDQLVDYKEILAKVQRIGDHTIEQVCNDVDLAFKYHFSAVEWNIRNTACGDGSRARPIYSRDYDRASIMHYASDQGGRAGSNPHDLNEVTMFGWRDNSGYHAPWERPYPNTAWILPQNLQVSWADRQGVVTLYNWNLA